MNLYYQIGNPYYFSKKSFYDNDNAELAFGNLVKQLYPAFSNNTDHCILQHFGYLYNRENPNKPISWLPTEPEKTVQLPPKQTFDSIYLKQFLLLLHELGYIHNTHMITIKDKQTGLLRQYPACSQTDLMKAETYLNLLDLRNSKKVVPKEPEVK